MPRNSLPNGKKAPDTGGDQLDESSYPILMAWQSGLAGDRALYRDHIKKAADFVVAHGPSFGSERWEEQGGFSPSTIAAEIAGLVAAGRIADVNHDPASARVYRATADFFQRSIKGWTVTTTGPYGRALLHPAVQDRRPERGHHLQPRQRRPGRGPARGRRRRLPGADPARRAAGDDPDVLASLPIVDQTIRRQTASGPASTGTAPTAGHRGRYGDCFAPTRRLQPATASRGRPATPARALWPVLSGERAEQQLQTGDRAGAAALLAAMNAQNLRRRAGARAGLGEPGPAALAVRQRSHDRIDRLRQRQARRLVLAADLGPGAAGATDPGAGRRRPLEQPAIGPRPVRAVRAAGDAAVTVTAARPTAPPSPRRPST
jgi:hypothetical protein